jgi:hypothetical protein
MHVVEGVKTPTNEGTSSVKVQKEDPYKEYRELEDTILFKNILNPGGHFYITLVSG